MFTNMTKQEIERWVELEEKATARYLDKTDFNPADWLDEEDQKEYNMLTEKWEKQQEVSNVNISTRT